MSTIETTTVTATKAPSNKSVAFAIFQEKLVERTQGLYASNKEFRGAVLAAMEAKLSVTRASAATMYNAAKIEAEKGDANIGLGRDPKKVKVKAEGVKRGRPVGSKNKAKETVVITTSATTEGSGYAEPAEAVAA